MEKVICRWRRLRRGGCPTSALLLAFCHLPPATCLHLHTPDSEGPDSSLHLEPLGWLLGSALIMNHSKNSVLSVHSVIQSLSMHLNPFPLSRHFYSISPTPSPAVADRSQRIFKFHMTVPYVVVRGSWRLKVAFVPSRNCHA